MIGKRKSIQELILDVLVGQLNQYIADQVIQEDSNNRLFFLRTLSQYNKAKNWDIFNHITDVRRNVDHNYDFWHDGCFTYSLTFNSLSLFIVIDSEELTTYSYYCNNDLLFGFDDDYIDYCEWDTILQEHYKYDCGHIVRDHVTWLKDIRKQHDCDCSHVGSSDNLSWFADDNGMVWLLADNPKVGYCSVTTYQNGDMVDSNYINGSSYVWSLERLPDKHMIDRVEEWFNG